MTRDEAHELDNAQAERCRECQFFRPDRLQLGHNNLICNHNEYVHPESIPATANWQLCTVAFCHDPGWGKPERHDAIRLLRCSGYRRATQ